MSTPAAFKPVQTPRAFEAIAAQIRAELSAGWLKSGERLPPERDLADALTAMDKMAAPTFARAPPTPW